MSLLYRGSVKDIYEKGTDLVFKYSNRYSVFDWGEMPNEIPQKGQCLALLAGYFFDYLKDKGVGSHYIGPEIAADSISVRRVDVIRPLHRNGQYEYSAYASMPVQTLVPLEVIFRFLLGQGNSLEGRLKKNPTYLNDLGLDKMPTAADKFTPALVEFSTKLESTDRYLTRPQIESMNVVSNGELTRIREITREIAGHLETLFASFGVKLWDGKFEFAFGNAKANGDRELFLVDSIGPDELRLTYNGLPLSKEFLRQIYTKTPWLEAAKKAKALADERGTEDWKEICIKELGEQPRPLKSEEIETASLLYKALTNEVAGALGRPKPFEATANLKTWSERCASLL